MDGEPSQAGRDSEVPHAEGEEHPDERRRPGRRPLIVLACVVAVVVIAGGWYYLATRDQESTDDAFTDGNAVTIARGVEAAKAGNRGAVARVICEALSDGVDQLRYVATDDIVPLLKARRETSEQEYIALMRSRFAVDPRLRRAG